MRLFPRSLFMKISLVFWGLIFISVGLQFCFQYFLWIKADLQRVQLVRWQLAENLARELREPLAKGIGTELKIALGKAALLNPDFDSYILNSKGEIVLSSIDDHPRVETIPVSILETFLLPSPNRELPIMAPDPSDPNNPKSFSVARIAIGEDPGYLFLILEGHANRIARTSLLNSYVIFGGLTSSLMLAILAAALGSAIFFLITKRFRALTATVKKIADGQYDSRTEVIGTDEVSQLGYQINKMAEKINDGVLALRRGDETRRRMVAYVSHDLRSPVAAIRAYSETLLEHTKSIGDSSGTKLCESMLTSTDSLTKLLGELFELSKLDAGEVTAEKELFSISDLLTEEILPEFEILGKRSNVSFKIEVPTNLPLVYGDIQLIYRAISNLCRNAIVHNHEGGTVVVSLENRSEKIKVSITDTGPGISPEELPQIFEHFYSGSGNSGKKRDSSGLGLAIVKRLLDLHGTNIEVKTSIGQGTTFSFDLPLSSA